MGIQPLQLHLCCFLPKLWRQQCFCCGVGSETLARLWWGGGWTLQWVQLRQEGLSVSAHCDGVCRDQGNRCLEGMLTLILFCMLPFWMVVFWNHSHNLLVFASLNNQALIPGIFQQEESRVHVKGTNEEMEILQCWACIIMIHSLQHLFSPQDSVLCLISKSVI